MQFKISKDGKEWVLHNDNTLTTTKYGSLFKLAKALMKYAKGQGL